MSSNISESSLLSFSFEIQVEREANVIIFFSTHWHSKWGFFRWKKFIDDAK